jgi:hypothetical protein
VRRCRDGVRRCRECHMQYTVAVDAKHTSGVRAKGKTKTEECIASTYGHNRVSRLAIHTGSVFTCLIWHMRYRSSRRQFAINDVVQHPMGHGTPASWG